jgi:uncharacterized repeat protein (TIGR02543 family)
MANTIVMSPVPTGYTFTGWFGTVGGKEMSGKDASVIFVE